LSISEHLSRSRWGPLGLESNAFYTLDREGGMERTYCCIFATARDFAKIGQLLLQDGQWGGRALLDKAFVERMRKPDLQPFYGHSLWMDWSYQRPFYLLQGHQGQYVIVVPAQGLVIVRTGHQGGKMERDQTGIIPSEVYRFVDQAVKLVH
jgi:CubicO group peptidase (beta-lactamase class C family)